MESVQSKFSVRGIISSLAIFKEPRGLIRLFQFIFAIFAFATACNGKSSMSINLNGQPSVIATSWSYPYKLQSSSIVYAVNGSNLNTISTANDAKPAAEFFVFTGVTSMLLALAFIVLYVVMADQYRNNQLFPTVDFTVTIIWTIFWIAGSSAWAQGVSNIRSQTAFDNVSQRSGACSGGSACTQSNSGNYANIIVSVIFGYLNFVLWVGSTWFVFKETRFFKARTVQQQQEPQPQAQPYGQPNAFSNIGSPSMAQQSQNRPAGAMGVF